MVLDSINGGIHGGSAGIRASLINREELDGAAGRDSGNHGRIEGVPKDLSTARSAGSIGDGGEEISRIVGDLLLLLEAGEVTEDTTLLEVPEENAAVSAGRNSEGEIITIPDQIQHTLGVTLKLTERAGSTATEIPKLDQRSGVGINRYKSGGRNKPTCEELETIIRRPGNMRNTAGVVVEQLTPHCLLTHIPNNDMTGSSAGTDNMADLGIPAYTRLTSFLNNILCNFRGIHTRLCKGNYLRIENIGNLYEMDGTIVATDAKFAPVIMAVETNGLNRRIDHLHRGNLFHHI